MCSTCGCEQSAFHINGVGHRTGPPVHTHDAPMSHQHDHHAHPVSPQNASEGTAGQGDRRLLHLTLDILGKNKCYADENRRYLGTLGVLTLNVVASPGAGKTTLLARTIQEMSADVPCAVIEGDQHTQLDAERLRTAGAQAVQINTGKGCHLDAHMVGHALSHLSLTTGSLLLIENVGNLVCPAEFDLGETHRVVLLSVTEGDDKPLKYPDIFASADLLLLTKIDLLPYVRFDVESCLDYARRVNPRLQALQLSATTGAGMPHWYAWLRSMQRNVVTPLRQP